MEKIKNLLNQVAIIDKKNAEILDATGGRFNMFHICGVNHYENTHSGIIAEFLNPKGTHGLKHKLLESFIETLDKRFTIQFFNFEKSRVLTEYSTEEGRIDILIEDNQNKAIIIENKIYANDQPEQLKRYNRYAKIYKNGYMILYLTLLGDKASKQSGEGVSYLPISHKKDIINWLEKCVAISSRLPMVRETIIQYINHLKQLTNQDMSKKNEEEITKVLSTIGNLRVAKAIYNNYPETFSYIVEEYFNPQMEKFAKAKGLEYNYQDSGELFIRFYLSSPNWQGRYWIAFTYLANNCRYGICNNPDIYKIPEAKIKIIHDRFNKLNMVFLQNNDWWPLYNHFTNLSLDVWEDDIIKSHNFLNDCKKKIEELLIAMEGVEL